MVDFLDSGTRIILLGCSIKSGGVATSSIATDITIVLIVTENASAHDLLGHALLEVHSLIEPGYLWHLQLLGLTGLDRCLRSLMRLAHVTERDERMRIGSIYHVRRLLTRDLVSHL